jgi:hypothetical protein
MNKNIKFIKNLSEKLINNYESLSSIMHETPDDIDQILETITQRDLIIKSITKLSLKLNQELEEGLLNQQLKTEFIEIKSNLTKMITLIEVQYSQLNISLATTRENLSNELKNVSINKNKIKGYNLNSVK